MLTCISISICVYLPICLSIYLWREEQEDRSGKPFLVCFCLTHVEKLRKFTQYLKGRRKLNPKTPALVLTSALVIDEVKTFPSRRQMYCHKPVDPIGNMAMEMTPDRWLQDRVLLKEVMQAWDVLLCATLWPRTCPWVSRTKSLLIHSATNLPLWENGSTWQLLGDAGICIWQWHPQSLRLHTLR